MWYGDKQKAVASIAHALQALPETWVVYGYRADASDGQTDYYQPARWDGVAIHRATGAILCVDVTEYDVESRSGGETKCRSVPDPALTCRVCRGTGKSPDGNASGAYGNRNLAMRYGHSADGCIPCGARGHLTRSETYREPWPVFQANPKHAQWHVEINGRIFAKGSGVYQIGDPRNPDGARKLARLLERVDAAVRKHPKRPTQPMPDFKALTADLTLDNVSAPNVVHVNFRRTA